MFGYEGVVNPQLDQTEAEFIVALACSLDKSPKSNWI